MPLVARTSCLLYLSFDCKAPKLGVVNPRFASDRAVNTEQTARVELQAW